MDVSYLLINDVSHNPPLPTIWVRHVQIVIGEGRYNHLTLFIR